MKLFNKLNIKMNILENTNINNSNNELIDLRYNNITNYLKNIEEELNNLQYELNNNLTLNKDYIKKKIEENNDYNNKLKILTTLYCLNVG